MRRSFFLPLMTYPDATSESAVESAVNFAARHSADLAGRIVDVDIPHISSPWSLPLIDTAGMVREAEGSSRANGARLGNLLKERCALQAVHLEVAHTRINLAEIADVVAAQGRLHDLIVARSGADPQLLNEAYIFGSGRPIVLLPEKPWNGVADHVAIAWDGGRAAARALGDASWLIERATRVSVLFSGEDKIASAPAAEQLCEALAKRGLPLELRAADAAGRAIGEVLQTAAIAAGADLMVMGGYGHSRLREFVLGGATAGVMARPMLPVLISH